MNSTRNILVAALSTLLLLGSSTAAAQYRPRIEVQIGIPALNGWYVGENHRFCFYRFPTGQLVRMQRNQYERYDRYDRYGRYDRDWEFETYERPYWQWRSCPQSYTIRLDHGGYRDWNSDRYHDWDRYHRDRRDYRGYRDRDHRGDRDRDYRDRDRRDDGHRDRRP
jgi:hypothetical protein